MKKHRRRTKPPKVLSRVNTGMIANMKNKVNRVLTAIAILTVLAAPGIASAHPGRTDVYGCHTCKTNCPKWGLSYGEYHCHNSKGLPQPSQPIKSHKTNSGVGYTTLAPEYEVPVANTDSDKKVISAQKPKERWLKGFLKKFGF